MKRKIIAIIAALTVGAGAGAYAVNGSAYRVPEVFQKDRQASATTSVTPVAARNTLSVSSGTVSVKIQKSSCPGTTVSASAKTNKTNKNAVAAKSSASSVSSTSSAQTASESSKGSTCSGNSCSSKQECALASCLSGKTCSSGNCTQEQNCGTVSVQTSVRSGASCRKLLENLLSRLKQNGSCSNSASSKTVSSRPANSAPSVSSKPAVSSTPSSQSDSGSGNYSSFQNEVVRLVNVEREKGGLKSLSVSAALTKTATLKSQDMVKNHYFSHTSPTYGSPFQMMQQFGISYRYAGENIAYGQTSPSQVMNGWMNSPGHRANIMSASYTQIGVGVARNSSGQYFWTQHFIG